MSRALAASSAAQPQVSGFTGAGRRLLQPHAVAGRDADVGVVYEPADCRARQCLRHELVEATWKWHRFTRGYSCCWLGKEGLTEGPRFSRQHAQ